MAPSSLRAFLTTAKTSLRSAIATHQRVNLVIGNESADLDSIACAIVYAYLRSASSLRNVAANRHPAIYVPLLNIPAADISIRPELLHLLPTAGLTPTSLITLSDLPPIPPNPSSASTSPSALSPNTTRWTLVDHNALQGPFGTLYSDHVVGCIDHHTDEHIVPSSDPDSSISEPRIITPTGSCTSLVVNHCRPIWDLLSSSSSTSVAVAAQDDASAGNDDASARREWDAQLARFALASILIDTSNLRDIRKVTEHDTRAVDYLEAKIAAGPGAAEWDREEFFKDLTRAKKDLDGLKLRDVLRKDYKEWVEDSRRLGVSSVVKPLEWMLSKAGKERQGAKGRAAFGEVLREWARERELAICAVMTTSTPAGGVFQRELLLWVLDPAAGAVLQRFEDKTTGELGLEGWQEQDLEVGDGVMKVWWQRDVGKSRKQVAPLLREAMRA